MSFRKGTPAPVFYVRLVVIFDDHEDLLVENMSMSIEFEISI
jgi:hypothetical protein